MAIKRRHQEILPPFQPPKAILTEEQVSRQYTKKIFTTSSDILKDAAGLLDKHVDKNAKALLGQTMPKLKQIREQIPASERVRDNITDYSLLKNALTDDKEMARFRELTGITASTGDLKFIERYVKQADSITPAQNHLEYMKELSEQMGFAKLEKGQIVKTDLYNEFKRRTGKKMDTLIPKKAIDLAMERGYLNDSMGIMVDSVSSGSLNYRQGLEQAANVYGKGTKFYESAKKSMYNAWHARLAKIRAAKEVEKSNWVQDSMKSKWDFGNLGKGINIPPDASPTEIQRVQDVYRKNAIASIINRAMTDRAGTGDLNKLYAETKNTLTEAKNVPLHMQDRILEDVKQDITNRLRPGLDKYYEDRFTVTSGSDEKAMTQAQKNQFKLAHTGEYYRRTAYGERYFAGFKDLVEESSKASVLVTADADIETYVDTITNAKGPSDYVKPDGVKDLLRSAIPEELLYKHALSSASGNHKAMKDADEAIRRHIESFYYRNRGIKEGGYPGRSPIEEEDSPIDKFIKDITGTGKGVLR